DLASKTRENFLYNRYVMGKNSIERGSTDTWTPAPHRYAAIQAELARGAGAGAAAGPGGPPAGAAGVGAAGAGAAGAAAAGGAGRGAGGGTGGGRGGGGRGGDENALWAALHRPADRDPRAYVLSAAQPDFATAARFINALLETGIKVHRATQPFTLGGKS